MANEIAPRKLIPKKYLDPVENIALPISARTRRTTTQ